MMLIWIFVLAFVLTWAVGAFVGSIVISYTQTKAHRAAELEFERDHEADRKS